MDETRASTPEAPPEDLWSSILDSVSSTRSIPSKQVLLLGKPSSGKSTLAAALLGKQVSDNGHEDSRDGRASDFAIGYEWADIRDDADEDTLARLSVYTVPSPEVGYTSLLPHFLPPRSSLPHTVVMITLDWTHPWTFVEELETWLEWVEHWVKGDGSRELEITREESHDRLQSHLQHYTEPTSDPIPATSTLSSATVLPLSQGTLTHNPSGIPIIIACTKSDLIDEVSDLVAGSSGMGGMVKGKGGEWEERTDGIMQILRTIALKYGAALFYTTPLPATLQALRQYTLHLLFVPPAPPPAGLSTEAPAPVKNAFPFSHKPNTLDRDRIIVPAGWDSWGKIAVLRDGFDARGWGDAWESDMEQGTNAVEDETGAKRMFAALVPDQGARPPPLPPISNPTPEQAFLAKNYDENSKKPNQDPRNAFKDPMANAAAGLVGPLESSSFNLPSVDRALTEMEAGVAPASGANLGASVTGTTAAERRLSRSTRAPTALPAVGPTAGASRAAPASPTPGPSVPPAAGGQTQHEVLQNFFNSLLSSKDRAGGSPGATKSSPPKANGAGAAEE
ncbi:hypothetical protein FIBSPDRAFT_542861 [Athelia psychrophila]|uniref:Dynein light intermediate chain n=1 Tax=Athelia psychrophila TaxID=1759441 RepID=A0A166ISH6_9AGAM|nr:hypothetical protein FIBSPDRAFT_542861 [Fibularhizoctonia sp. CBS 109695]